MNATRNASEMSPGPRAPWTGRGSGRRATALGLSAAVGMVLALLWPYAFVDNTVAGSVTHLAFDSTSATALSGAFAGSLFAFVTGLAGTFTACNIAAFGALGPMFHGPSPERGKVRVVLPPLAWMAAGMLGVSAAYGAIGVVVGTRMPQLSDAVTSAGMPVRLVQASAVFTVLGIVLVYLGLAAAGLVPDLLRRATVRWEHSRVVVMGVIIGGFLIGRPFPLFRELFVHAAEQGNPAYGAFVFVLQSVGNIVVIGALFALVVFAARRRVAGWAATGGAERLTAVALTALGVFTVLYWGARVPANFGYGWFPVGF